MLAFVLLIHTLICLVDDCWQKWQELIISWNDTTTYTFIYTATNDCYINSIWLYPICYDHTKYFVRSYSLFFSWPRQYYWLNNSKYEQLAIRCGNTEAILLTALLHGNTNVKVLKVVRKVVSYEAARIIGDFIKANITLRKLERMIKN